MQPVARRILFMLSRWRMVTRSFSPKYARAGTISVTTMANPLKMAPATKYGGKIVACQPGNWATAKSVLTTECTEITSGVANPARNKYAHSYTCHCRAEPRHPKASVPKMKYRSLFVARSRKVARSGIIPRYQNISETAKYVETANTSQSSGLRKFGHSDIWFG